jgi:hypothetical protein
VVNRDSICQCAAQFPHRYRRHHQYLAGRWLRCYWRPDCGDGNLQLPAGDSIAYADGVTHRYSHGDSDSYGVTHGHSYSYSHGDSDGYRYGNADGYSYGDGKRYAKCNSNGNADSYADPFGYAERDSDAFSDSNRHTYAECYAGRVCVLTRLLEKPSPGVASDRVAAWEHHLYPGTIAGDPARASPWEWTTYPCPSGNCRETEHCQRRGWKLHPANIS